MIYRPKSNKKGAITAVILMIISVDAAAVAPVVSGASGAINIAAIFLLVAALFVTTRFAMSAYEYRITEDDVVVTRTIGAKTTTVAALSLQTGEGIVKRPRKKDEKKAFADRFGKTEGRLNYCRNLFADQYVYVTEFNGKRYEILLEASEEFASALEEAVENAHARYDEE